MEGCLFQNCEYQKLVFLGVGVDMYIDFFINYIVLKLSLDIIMKLVWDY